MSSFSSFAFVSDVDSNPGESDWSHIDRAASPLHSDGMRFEQPHDINSDAVESTPAATASWSCVHDHPHAIDANDFDIHSMNSVASVASVASGATVDTIKANFVFGDYTFTKRAPSSAGHAHASSANQWMWLRTNKRGLRSRRRRRQQQKARDARMHHNSLCVIDENGAMMMENSDGEHEQEQPPSILDIKDLNRFINESVDIDDDLASAISFCNQLCEDGVLRVRQTQQIDLHDIPLIAVKLREILFRKLVLFHNDDSDGSDRNNADAVLTSAQKSALRRHIWLKLQWNARVFLCPFASFDNFLALYNVHASVKCNEFLAVLDEESFAILNKPEWVRVVLFKSYIAKIQRLKTEQRREIELKHWQQMNEMRSLLMMACREDDGDNLRRFQQQQMSLILGSEEYTAKDADDTESIAAFEALEREIDLDLQS
eukprot:CAMPEP_0202728228 /NCGR_PEP_ID=MMETSP1385-20130828/185522_1 /ASSEMBLY_ACC=CAM_ASM_000861 /TAXON_ID=933848 /ORGANISM="Elphidium margaritaceum" /LENGTH=430 /DNA_ID=CAMNT_0049394475 /DNA_START=29 /DNA_END=1321 /DNA_ORIENTATION=-